MKNRIAFAVAALTLATGAMAQGYRIEPVKVFPAGQTRAEVLADLDRAQRNGSIDRAGEGGAFIDNEAVPSIASSRSRDVVRAELGQAVRSSSAYTNPVY